MNSTPRELTQKRQNGVQSVEIGLRLAFALAKAKGALPLRELAEQVGLPPSKAHRYLVSLTRAGITEQSERNGHYDLGPGAILLGIAALGRLDEQRMASDALMDLHEATRQTAAALVWGNHGPTIILRRESLRPATVNTRVGSVLSTIGSASGRVFAAFLPRELTQPLIDAEFAEGVSPTYLGRPLTRESFEKLVDNIRRTRLARVRGDLLAGVDAVSAPVFNHEGQLSLVLSVWGVRGALDISQGGTVDQILTRVAEQGSNRLGYVTR